ncbi:hypothetical protein SAMN05444921_111215 [Streptomyces wuyuanensis]|uniref:Uncharacterized protein n=1 Tax=Streptomyces wuyuanensis TaxID=1196353 RepID=A0A1G9V4V6_9ACTN|nr:hypothetical protein SAMN05444921_111215 [Streptomyces wuyuanensis]
MREDDGVPVAGCVPAAASPSGLAPVDGDALADDDVPEDGAGEVPEGVPVDVPEATVDSTALPFCRLVALSRGAGDRRELSSCAELR